MYTGEIDHDRPGYPDARLTLYELHAQYRTGGLELRGLFVQSFLSNAADLTRALRADPDSRIFGTNQTLSDHLGGYAEVAYDIWPHLGLDRDYYLAPFFRFEYYNTQWDTPSGPEFSEDGTNEIRLYHMGLSFKPHPQVVLKLDYRNFRPVKGGKSDDLHLGVGVAF